MQCFMLYLVILVTPTVQAHLVCQASIGRCSAASASQQRPDSTWLGSPAQILQLIVHFDWHPRGSQMHLSLETINLTRSGTQTLPTAGQYWYLRQVTTQTSSFSGFLITLDATTLNSSLIIFIITKCFIQIVHVLIYQY